MTESQARSDICRVGSSLFARGYVHASAGNISVKLQDGSFLITPTDACLGNLVSQDLSFVSPNGEQISGLTASKTLLLHRNIYASDLQAECIIHTHSSHLVSLSLNGVWKESDILPPITPYYVMKVGHIPLINYRRPGAPDIADLVVQQIMEGAKASKPIRGVMLDRLGPVVWHRTPAETSAVLEELEETAKIWLMANRQVAPLSEAQIEELRRTFGVIW